MLQIGLYWARARLNKSDYKNITWRAKANQMDLNKIKLNKDKLRAKDKW